MKELQELREDILLLKNIGTISKEVELVLLRKLNSIEQQLTLYGVVNCKHEDYTPCYGREGELMFKQCNTCGQEFD